MKGLAPASGSTGQSTALDFPVTITVIWRAGRGWKACGKSVGPSGNQSPCDAVLAGFPRSRDFFKWSAARCRARRSSRSPQDAAATHDASWHFDDRSFRVMARLGQSLVTPIFEHALNRVHQILEGFIAGQTLSMRLGHFGTGCDEKLFTVLNDGSELVFHAAILSVAGRPINPQSPCSLTP